LLFEFKSVKWLYVAFGFTLVFTFIQWNHFSHEVDQKQMVVYSISKHRAIEFIDRGHSCFKSDSLLLTDTERIRFHILPNRLIHGVAETEFEIPFSVEKNGVNYFQWNNNIIAWIDSKDDQLPKNTSIDFLVVSGNSLSKNRIAELNVKQIIFDASNSKKYVEVMSRLAGQNQISAYSVLKGGAFINQ
jgi:hypothetical protein